MGALPHFLYVVLCIKIAEMLTRQGAAMTYPEVSGLDVRLDRGVLRVTIDVPSRRNALDDRHARSVRAGGGDGPDRRAGPRAADHRAGDHFAAASTSIGPHAGGGSGPGSVAIQRRLPAQAHRLIPLLGRLQVPVVARVRGFAVGIGMQLLLVSDFVVATHTGHAVGAVRLPRHDARWRRELAAHPRGRPAAGAPAAPARAQVERCGGGRLGDSCTSASRTPSWTTRRSVWWPSWRPGRRWHSG